MTAHFAVELAMIEGEKDRGKEEPRRGEPLHGKKLNHDVKLDG